MKAWICVSSSGHVLPEAGQIQRGRDAVQGDPDPRAREGVRICQQCVFNTTQNTHACSFYVTSKSCVLLKKDIVIHDQFLSG